MENSYTSDTDSDLFEFSYFCFLQNDFLLFFFCVADIFLENLENFC